MKLMVSFISSPSPSVRRLVPWPYFGCLTRVPMIHFPADLFGGAGGFGRGAFGRALITASTELYVVPSYAATGLRRRSPTSSISSGGISDRKRDGSDTC